MKKLRNQIGLTQSDMAKLIGSNKTTCSLYEKGLRELNTKELRMLSKMELLMNHSAAIQATEKTSFNDEKALADMLKKLASDQKDAALKHEITRIKLSRMEEANASNEKLWHLLNELKTNMEDMVNPYAGVLEMKCLEKFKSCGLHQQILLRHQLAILEGEMASAQKLIEEYGG